MAIRVGGTVVVDDGRAISNVTNVSATDATFSGTGAIKFPSGTTEEQPAVPATGMVRYNTTKKILEMYNGTVWTSVGSQVVTGGAYFIAASSQFN